MPTELMKQLLEAGVHFGHQAKRWNPKMAKFIFNKRSEIYIIDLEKTVECLNQARDFLLDIASQGKIILFAGTKRQAQEVIKREAIRCGMFYVNQRWLGGLLTNFQTIKKSIQRLKEIEKMKEDGLFSVLSKKEVASLTKEKDKLNKNLCGIKDMGGLPDAIFIIDSKKEETAIKEAARLSIPIVALIDTNCNPDEVTFPVPGNDDAIKSISLITTLIADTVLEGRKKFLSYLAESKEPVILKAKEEKKEEEIPLIIPPVEEIEEIEEVLKVDEDVPSSKRITRSKPVSPIDKIPGKKRKLKEKE